MSCLKLINGELELPIVLSEDYVRLLIVENPNLFWNFINQLNAQINGGEGHFALFSDGKELSIADTIELLYDYYNFDFNDKKMLGLLYKKIEKEGIVYHFEKIYDANSYLSSLMINILEDLPFKLTFDDITINSLLKAMSVKFENSFDSLEEKIICFINIIVALKRCKIIVFVNLKSILSDEQLLSVYHHCNLEKICLILIENSISRKILQMEKTHIVTEDLCEIVANYNDIC